MIVQDLIKNEKAVEFVDKNVPVYSLWYEIID